MTWDEATVEAVEDEDLIPIVYAMCAGGYADFADWAEEILKKELA